MSLIAVFSFSYTYMCIYIYICIYVYIHTYISWRLLLQITTKLEAENNRKLFSYSSGAPNVSGPCCLWGFCGRIHFLFQLLIIPGVPWLITASLQLYLCGHIISYSYLSVSFFLTLTRMLVIRFRAHFDDPK